MVTKGGKQLAKLENDLVLKAHYSLTAVEQKLVLHLASKLDPKKDEHFVKQVVPLKAIEKVLWGNEKKFGALYEYLNGICTKLLDRKISFPKNAKLEGGIYKGGAINWFQSILVIENENKEVSIEFMFSERMKPFLLQLNKYVSIDPREVMGMRSAHSIRMYEVFRAERERTKKYKAVTSLKYEIDELKAMLGIAGKYKAVKDFKKNVLDLVKREVNQESNLVAVDYICHKTGRRISSVEFLISDKAAQRVIELPIAPTDYVPTDKEIDGLTKAQRKAHKDLVAFGVKSGIAFKRIIPTILGSEIEGFEDLFVKYAILHFQKKSKNQKSKDMSAGTFVNWWHRKKVFDNNVSGNVWGMIMESLVSEKKSLDKEAFDNRMIAKDMSHKEFVAWYKKNKQN